MPTYVSLINWTDQRIRVGRETVQRGARADEIAQKHGARFKRTPPIEGEVRRIVAYSTCEPKKGGCRRG
jgi:uncharacterized protein with GYD domain